LILAAVGFLYWALVTTIEREDDEFLAEKARVLAAMAQEAGNDERELRQEIERESAPRATGQLYLRVLDARGKTIAETAGMSDQLRADRFPQPSPAVRPSDHVTELRSEAGQSFRALSQHVPADSQREARVIQVAMDRTVEEELLARYRLFAGATLFVALLSSTAAGYALARRGLRPLREITATAQRIRSSTLDERIDGAALPVELAVLAGTFNEMLDRLEDSFRRLERFSADIAHELRTPVNNLRGEVEVALGQSRSAEAYRDILASSLEEFGRLANLIDSLLFLARAESPEEQLVKKRVDVGQELDTVREFYEAAANEAGIRLEVQAAQGIIAALDRTLFQRAIGNLIANALAHTQRGGLVTLTAVRYGDAVHIEVRDTGAGIAPEHLPHVFDRFFRADPARTSGSGSVGLGLALVKSIVVLHKGSCSVTSEVGHGTCIRLVFPAC
jgi:two-component system heavy metal sensor histidine kinase CusS